MSNTVVILAHPYFDTSSSHQFLWNCGQALTEAVYVDLREGDGLWDTQVLNEHRRVLMEADRILLQFPLYWYQAPALLKQWLDQLLTTPYQNPSFAQALVGKELGLVITADVAGFQYQAGGREGRTISELMTPYELLARYYQMNYLMPFVIHRFRDLSEMNRVEWMYRYACYLETGDYTDERQFNHYLIDKAHQLTAQDFSFDEYGWIGLNHWIASFEDQVDTLNHLYELTGGN